MARKASGKKAWGFSDRSGRRYRLKEMRTEWTGVKVGPDEFEEKHPQLTRRSHGGDAEALNDPRPPIEQENINLEILGYDTVNLRYRDPITATGQVGRVTLGGDATPTEYVYFNIFGFFATASVTSNLGTAANTYFPDGFEATMSLGVISTESLEVDITGVSATGSPANSNLSIAFSVPGNATLAGFGITASQGTITITPSTTHTPTGVSGTVGQGTITATAEVNPSVTITGVQAITFDNAINPYRDIDDDGDVTDFYSGAGNGASVIAETGQTGTLQGNSGAGYEIEVQGRLFTDTSTGTDYFGTTGAQNGRDDVSLKITNKTGSSITIDSSSRLEVVWRFNKTADGLLDDERHVGVQFHFPMTPSANNLLNSNAYSIGSYLAGAHNLPSKANQFRFFENRADTGAGYSTPVYNDTNTQFTAKSTSGAANSYTWANNASVYFGTRFSQFPINVLGTDYGVGFINAGFVIERITVMFAETTDNWTSTTAQADGFRIEFDDPASGGVGAPTINITEPLILTGLEAKATMNDPWNEDDDHGGDGFAEVDGSPSTNWRYTPSPVLRLGWHLDISTPQTWEVSANGSTSYNFYSPVSGTTYSNPDLHLHKDNQYIFDMSDSSLQSHPFRVQQTGTSSTGVTSTSYNNASASTYRGTFGATNYSFNNEGNAGGKLYIYPLHADGRPNGVYGDADPSDATQDRPKSRIGNRTLFYRCSVHAAMRGRFHMAPYCEWPVQGTPDAGTDVAGGDYLEYWTKPS